MQVTLVSHYGDKPDSFAGYVRILQGELKKSIGDAFLPYDLGQVHGTIIGLEGCRNAGRLRNSNYQKCRDEVRYMRLEELLAFLRGPNLPAFRARIGGYVDTKDYGFDSRGKHPYYRSFSIQGSIAVAIGWPKERPRVLDELRRSFRRMGILHKWHSLESDVDDDLFFVLGRVNRKSVCDKQVAKTENHMRDFMATLDPVTVNLNRSHLTLVGYSDAMLPMATSHAHEIDSRSLNAKILAKYYDDCQPDD